MLLIDSIHLFIPIFFLALCKYSETVAADFETIETTFRNPIHSFVPPFGCADPYIYLHTDNFYYWARCGLDNTIVLFKSQDLTNFHTSNGSMNRTIFAAPRPTDAYLIEPKIHFIGGDWYIYFSMTLDGVRDNRQNFVIKSAEAFGPYGEAIRLETDTMYAIHGTVLQHDNGQLYFLWAGQRNVTNETEARLENGIFIAKMVSPSEITGGSILLRKPMSDWEENGVLESPAILQNFGKTCVAYSDVFNLKVGLICVEDWKHPLVVGNWAVNQNGPHLWDSEEEQVYLAQGGKVSFTMSPDRTQFWMVYKAYDKKGGNLSIRLERFGWLPNGYPSLPRPTGLDKDITMPSNNREKKFNSI